jgi:hypothetical protein
MQKVINVLALVSFGVSSCVVGAGAYVYMNQEQLKQQAIDAAKAEMGNMLGGQLGQVLMGGPSSPGSESPVPLPVPMPSFPGM